MRTMCNKYLIHSDKSKQKTNVSIACLNELYDQYNPVVLLLNIQQQFVLNSRFTCCSL